jgi:hypothetical protein
VKFSRKLAGIVALLVVLPILTSTGCMLLNVRGEDWRSARRDSSLQAPDPATHADAVVQRCVLVRARLPARRIAVHTWIAVSRQVNRIHATRSSAGRRAGLSALRVSRGNATSVGAEPQKPDRRGDGVDALIGQIEKA